IPPGDRPRIFDELNRVTKRGGRLIFQGTPNRLYPVDFHTTDLFLVPYLPDKIALWYIRHLSKRIKKDNPQMSWDELIARGVRGSSYFSIKRYFPNMELLNTDDYDRIFKSVFLPHRLSKRIFMLPYYIMDKTICKLFNIPLSVFLKDLQFVLKKN
ncbi:MAG: hypothetical protein ABFR82_18010, partial [Nitrospirota bacterium]